MAKFVTFTNANAPYEGTPILINTDHIVSVYEDLTANKKVALCHSLGIHLIGKEIKTGFLLGHVNETEVRSAFSGEIQGFLAIEGERVTSSQPIAWLRVIK